jgi:SAM-dependent methyltransferase
VSREDVRRNLASWEAESDGYQTRNSAQLNRWERLGWGIWDIPEDEVRALGDVRGLAALELGCGAAQFGIRVARMGADVTGLDFSANQLRHAVVNIAATGTHLALVRASAEELPFADATFDLVFCDHGATSFTDPTATVPEVARVLRPGGRFVFNIAAPFAWTTWSEEDEPSGRELRRPYFGQGRIELVSGEDRWVEWYLPTGEWIRIFRRAGLAIDDLIELRAPADADTTYEGFATVDWAQDYPGEHIWALRKA